jgi:hypothetical protein
VNLLNTDFDVFIKKARKSSIYSDTKLIVLPLGVSKSFMFEGWGTQRALRQALKK